MDLGRGSRENSESKMIKEKMVSREGMGTRRSRRKDSLAWCLRVINKDPGLPSLTTGLANRMWHICCYRLHCDSRLTRL